MGRHIGLFNGYRKQQAIMPIVYPDVHKHHKERTTTMPKRDSPKATGGTRRRTRKTTPRGSAAIILELSQAMRERLAELDKPRPIIDDICPACGCAAGVPKILRGGKTKYICVPCVLALQYHHYTPDLIAWRLIRLPYYRFYLNHPDKASEHLMLSTRQDNYSNV